MKFSCFALILFTLLSVHSFHNEISHRQRFGWRPMWEHRRGIFAPVVVEKPIGLDQFGRPIVVEEIIRPVGHIQRPIRVFKKSLDETTFNCTHLSLTNSLVCTGPKTKLECSAIRITDDLSLTAFKMFGISSMPIGDWTMKPEEIKFSLYPQQLNSTNYLDAVSTDSMRSNKKFTYSLYYSKKYTDNGLRFENKACWEKFIDLYPILSAHVHTISVIKQDSSMLKVGIFGTLSYL